MKRSILFFLYTFFIGCTFSGSLFAAGKEQSVAEEEQKIIHAIKETDRHISRQQLLIDSLKNEAAALEIIREQSLEEQQRLSSQKTELEQEVALAEVQRAKTEKQFLQSAEGNTEFLKKGLLVSVFIALFTLIVWYYLSTIRKKYRVRQDLVAKELKDVQQKLMDKEVLAARGEVTAGVAHEIRNPLNFINNFSDVSKELIDEFLKTEEFDGRKELLDSIRDNILKVNVHGKRAASIITGMKEQNHGKSALNLCDLLRESVVLGTYNNQVKPFRIIEEYDPQVKLIHANRTELQRVFLNLISNAVYALNKKVEMESSDWKPEIKIKVSKITDQVSITISDNGPGIPVSVSEKLFTPFYTTKPAGVGTGLGLSMSKEIIEEHKGKITLNSVEGTGTAFYIMLPASES